ncbi:hypothetical protein FRC00_012715 [Tulasnella sp. 408]|nr:hypothetical protein FRC00_012715 [Tulasnella sp. 408]
MRKLILRYHLRSRACLESNIASSDFATVFARGVKERSIPIRIRLSSSIAEDDVLRDADLYFPEEEDLSELDD